MREALRGIELANGIPAEAPASGRMGSRTDEGVQGRGSSAAKGARHVRAVVLPPVVLGIIVVVAWEAFVNWQRRPPFVMPKPSAIWSEFTDNFRSSATR